ncbi:hypothetical protein [Candidatus Nanohalococcus occultus]|uniref:hypothetical protein n=1 Tax=Candidatus Nanohalococcus occultus TaxID=2978047 RepID=UPI0039E0E275
MSRENPEWIESLERTVETIDRFMEAFKTEKESDIGIALFPKHQDTKGMMEIYITDMSYGPANTGPNLSTNEEFTASYEEFRDEIYPTWTSKIEETYREAEVMYPDDI